MLEWDTVLIEQVVTLLLTVFMAGFVTGVIVKLILGWRDA